jgi:predicted enzyme related to lactoylglutathione lyase
MNTDPKTKNIIDWFDIPVADLGRAKKFYEAILETELQIIRFPNGLEIALFPVIGDSVSGALACHNNEYKPSAHGTLIYINGDPDLQLILDKIEGAGGKILLNKSLISEHWGYMALFLDSEGNRIALHSKK